MPEQLAQGLMAAGAVRPQVPTRHYYTTRRKSSGLGLEVQSEHLGSVRR